MGSFLDSILPSFLSSAASTASGGTATPAPKTDFFSSFTSPEVLSAGIMSAASLFSGLYGSDLNEEQIEQARLQFEQNLALSREKLAQDKELTLAQIAASGAASSAAAEAAKRQADIQLAGLKSQSFDRIADRRIEARKGKSELTLAGRSGQAAQASNTGRLGIEAFRNLIGAVQAPLLS